MNQDLEKKLVERWPSWFNIHGDIRHTVMPFGFECGDGWFVILWELCERIEPLIKKAEAEHGALAGSHPDWYPWHFEVVQVKEKYPSLRFYTNGHPDAVDEHISWAEQQSCKTCEECGQPGIPEYRGGYYRTLCEEHHRVQYPHLDWPPKKPKER